jgi:hypothetical protein
MTVREPITVSVKEFCVLSGLPGQGVRADATGH